MKVIQKIKNWGNSHHPKILDIIRMILGIFLLVKGVVFLNATPFLRDIFIRTHAIRLTPAMITVLINYVILVHMIGGVLIFLGLLTRVAALVQVPVVFGAVFFVNILNSFFNSELWLSVLILALLVIFFIIGSGPLSLDHFFTTLNTGEKQTPTDHGRFP
jgi:putative oxidoreductase